MTGCKRQSTFRYITLHKDCQKTELSEPSEYGGAVRVRSEYGSEPSEDGAVRAVRVVIGVGDERTGGE
jgi:hypothetical protein